jgi:hypothetical protein
LRAGFHQPGGGPPPATGRRRPCRLASAFFAAPSPIRFEPDAETTNRKPLRRPALFEAQWELRCGLDNRFRVFYEIDRESRKIYLLAIGVKERNRLLIGGEEVEL